MIVQLKTVTTRPRCWLGALGSRPRRRSLLSSGGRSRLACAAHFCSSLSCARVFFFFLPLFSSSVLRCRCRGELRRARLGSHSSVLVFSVQRAPCTFLFVSHFWLAHICKEKRKKRYLRCFLKFVRRGEVQDLGAGEGLTWILRSYLVCLFSVTRVTPFRKASFSLSR